MAGNGRAGATASRRSHMAHSPGTFGPFAVSTRPLWDPASPGRTPPLVSAVPSCGFRDEAEEYRSPSAVLVTSSIRFRWCLGLASRIWVHAGWYCTSNGRNRPRTAPMMVASSARVLSRGRHRRLLGVPGVPGISHRVSASGRVDELWREMGTPLLRSTCPPAP